MIINRPGRDSNPVPRRQEKMTPSTASSHGASGSRFPPPVCFPPASFHAGPSPFASRYIIEENHQKYDATTHVKVPLPQTEIPQKEVRWYSAGTLKENQSRISGHYQASPPPWQRFRFRYRIPGQMFFLCLGL